MRTHTALALELHAHPYRFSFRPVVFLDCLLRENHISRHHPSRYGSYVPVVGVLLSASWEFHLTQNADESRYLHPLGQHYSLLRSLAHHHRDNVFGIIPRLCCRP